MEYKVGDWVRFKMDWRCREPGGTGVTYIVEVVPGAYYPYKLKPLPEAGLTEALMSTAAFEILGYGFLCGKCQTHSRSCEEDYLCEACRDG